MELLPFREARFLFHHESREKWKEGSLVEEWAREYPFLFDLDNWRNAKIEQHERGYHFAEWFAAKRLFEEYGLHSIVGKYVFKSHEWKYAAFRCIIRSPKKREFLCQKGLKRPDLLVYSPDLSAYCFAEVKGPGNGLHQAQEKDFRKIADRLKAQVALISVKKCTKVGCHGEHSPEILS
jgi:hypothetical protein